MCRYECGTELGDFDEQQNKYRELTGTLHTMERCQSIKSQSSTSVGTKTLKEGQIGTPQQFVREVMEGPKLKELDDRLKKVEALLFEGDKK